MRCLSFAETLDWAGWSCTFATRRESLDAAPGLVSRGYDIMIIEDDGETRPSGDPRLAVVDHYGLDAAFERPLAGPNRTMIVFDDLADRPHVCDILLDPTPGRIPDAYRANIPDACRLMLGPNHALIRSDWIAARARARSRLAAGLPVERLVVSMGATDPSNATARVLDAVASTQLNIDVI